MLDHVKHSDGHKRCSSTLAERPMIGVWRAHLSSLLSLAAAAPCWRRSMLLPSGFSPSQPPRCL